MGHKFVGILLNAAMHRGVPRLRTRQESLSNYEEAAAAYGMVPCFLKLADVDIESGYCAAYIMGAHGYRYTVLPIPEVIHNRAIYAPDLPAMNRLIQSGPIVFNECNRYGKDEIHALLENNKELSGYLPDTRQGLGGLQEMMNLYPDLILKPCRGSIGSGVMRLAHQGQGIWSWFYHSPAGRWHRVQVNQKALPRTLLSRLSYTPYLVQERIPLAEFGGRPFDLRVTVQRGWGGDWQVTGSFAKLAAPGEFVSNIARGGEAVSASSALAQVFSGEVASHLHMAVGSLSLAVARQLSLSLPGLADIGLDIGITRDAHLYFIECNGRDQRYGFRKAGLQDVWKTSYNKPMGYARYRMEI